MNLKNQYNNLCLWCASGYYPLFAILTIALTYIAIGVSAMLCAPCQTCVDNRCSVTTILSSDEYACRVELRYVRGDDVGYFPKLFDTCPEIGDVYDCFRKNDGRRDITHFYLGKYDRRPFHEQCPVWTGIAVSVYIVVILLWVLICLYGRRNKKDCQRTGDVPLDQVTVSVVDESSVSVIEDCNVRDCMLDGTTPLSD